MLFLSSLWIYDLPAETSDAMIAVWLCYNETYNEKKSEIEDLYDLRGVINLAGTQTKCIHPDSTEGSYTNQHH